MKQNRYVAAFRESYNLLGLAATTAVACAMLHPLPLLIGAVAETAYLLFYADSRWYQVRMAKKFDSEVEARRAELKNRILPLLDASMQARFQRLEKTRHNLEEQRTDPENQEWFQGVLRKLDFLLEKWLQFADRDVEFLRYLESVREQLHSDGASPNRSTDSRTFKSSGHLSAVPLPAKGSTLDRRIAKNRQAGAGRAEQKDETDEWVRKTVADIQTAFDAELADIADEKNGRTDTATIAILDRRIRILNQRRESVEKIARIHGNLDNQLCLVEDTVGLISDGVRARSPEQVLAAIDDVVSQTTTMTQLLDEVAPYEQLLAS